MVSRIFRSSLAGPIERSDQFHLAPPFTSNTLKRTARGGNNPFDLQLLLVAKSQKRSHYHPFSASYFSRRRSYVAELLCLRPYLCFTFEFYGNGRSRPISFLRRFSRQRMLMSAVVNQRRILKTAEVE